VEVKGFSMWTARTPVRTSVPSNAQIRGCGRSSHLKAQGFTSPAAQTNYPARSSTSFGLNEPRPTYPGVPGSRGRPL
jgi:hypothetical protein